MLLKNFGNSIGKIGYILLLIGFLFGCSNKQDYAGYLFVYFTGNGPGEEQVHYAISEDGLNFIALNDNKPIISSEDISFSGGVRDPHILRSPDGSGFYMVLTDLYVPEMGWQNKAMVMLKSDDLIHWEHSKINIPETYPVEFGQVNRVWAPQTIYDKNVGNIWYISRCGRIANRILFIIPMPTRILPDLSMRQNNCSLVLRTMLA